MFTITALDTPNATILTRLRIIALDSIQPTPVTRPRNLPPFGTRSRKTLFLRVGRKCREHDYAVKPSKEEKGGYIKLKLTIQDTKADPTFGFSAKSTREPTLVLSENEWGADL